MVGPIWQSAVLPIGLKIFRTLWNFYPSSFFFFFSIVLGWSRTPSPKAHSDIFSTFSSGSFISIYSVDNLVLQLSHNDTSSTKLGISVNSMDSSDSVMISYTLESNVKNDPLLQKSSSQIEREVSSINPAVKTWHFQEMSSPQRWVIIF